MNIEISDRLYRQLTDFCKINELDLQTYIIDKIERGFSIDRFGDLNVISGVKKPEEVEKVQNGIIEIKSAIYDDVSKQIKILYNNDREYIINIKDINGFFIEDKFDTTKALENVKEETKIKRRQIKSK